MEIVVKQKQITNEERAQVTKQVRSELVDHLYEGCLPGTISGLVVSAVLFLDYYHYTPTNWLIAWITGFNLMMLTLTGLFFGYKKYKSEKSLFKWELAYSATMIGCALAWVPLVLLIPDDTTRQYLALIALFLATTGYATGSIGQFYLCVVTLNIMLLPLIVWCFIKGGIFYNIIGVYSLIYMFFMYGINFRSTQWFKESLKLKLENTLVSYHANHDMLTDLPNQRLLPQYIDSALNFAKSSQKVVALICFSLNRMEIINDSLGHHAGNELIQAVAARLRELAQKAQKQDADTQYILSISRKDTFNIILITNSQDAIDAKVGDVFNVLDEPFFLDKRTITMTASAGVAVYPKDGEDANALLINSDSAMLKAKQFGGNKIEYYRAEINAQTPKQLELENDLYDALKNNHLLVNYQPLVDVATGTIVGSEALIRWKHPVHGMISPMHFIPVAEETGLIVPIGEWIMREACKQTQKWHDMGFTQLKVAVNLSEKQLRDREIIETIKRALLYTGLEAKYLELELTETAILDEKVIDLMKEFKNLGASLAVDDFGTGYSGLSYLKRFSIDKLKIDQSFIRDIPHNQESLTIVAAILAMAKELKVASLAEGVEKLEQLEFLRERGCNYIQGYYFSKPLEHDVFTQLLLEHRTKSMYEKNGIKIVT